METKIDREFINHLLLGRQTSFMQYDKAILTLSSGGLALSLAFLRDIAQLYGTNYLILLIVSWALFASAIISTVCSFVASQIAFDYQIKIEQKRRESPNHFAQLTKYLNWVSGGFFVIAVIVTVIFVSLTILKEEASMNGDPKYESGIGGIVPPVLQQVEPEGEPMEKGIVPPENPETSPDDIPVSDDTGGGEIPDSSGEGEE